MLHSWRWLTFIQYACAIVAASRRSWSMHAVSEFAIHQEPMKSWVMCIVWHRQGQACSNGWQSLLWVGLRGMVRPSSGLSGNFDSVCKTYILGASLLPWYLQPEDCSWYWDCFYLDKVNPLPLPPCSALYNKGAGLLGCWASSVRESGPDASFFFF